MKQGDWLIPKTHDPDNIPRWFDAFLLDRRAQGMATGTLEFYRWKLRLVDLFLSSQNIRLVSELTPDLVRSLLIHLEETHNPGGTHQVYRALRTFLNWYAIEADPPDWHNPMSNVKPPKLVERPLAPISITYLKKLVAACPDNFTGIRDRAIMLFLFDTGLRAAELIALDREDVDEIDGSVNVRNGKGGKPRLTIIGKRTRKALRAFLRSRSDEEDALFVTDDLERMSYRGLDNMLRRRAELAKVPKPTLHSFRRAFALNSLRNGMDVFSLQRLMGHADLQVMRRYLAQTDDDLRTAHAKASPVDCW